MLNQTDKYPKIRIYEYAEQSLTFGTLLMLYFTRPIYNKIY